MSTLPYRNLKSPKNTTSGISDFFLIAPVADFVEGGIKCPAVPQGADPAGQSVKILEPHEFVANRGFAKIMCAPDKNSFDGKMMGDLGSNKFDFEHKVFVPGSYAELHEGMANLLNTPCIVLFKDAASCSENLWYQLGCDCTSAYIIMDWSSGTTKDGAKGYMATVKWSGAFVQLYAHVDGPEVLAD